jgi:hypothetical protein
MFSLVILAICLKEVGIYPGTTPRTSKFAALVSFKDVLLLSNVPLIVIQREQELRSLVNILEVKVWKAI